MALQKTEKLMLVEAEQIELDDKDNPGKKIKKWKYTFISPEGTFVVGYADTDTFKKDLVTGGKYDPELAKDYTFVGKIFKGMVSWRLKA